MNVNPAFAKLFEPTKIASMYLKNRLVMSPMTLNFNFDFRIDDQMIEFYEERAKGGIGMIITDCMPVSAMDPNYAGHPFVGTNLEHREWLKLAKIIKPYGTRLCLQMGAGVGRVGGPPANGQQAISSCEQPLMYAPNVNTRALTIDEIHKFIDAFASQAAAAKSVGFDAVEIHAHLGLLLDQFMTAKWNHRTDEYGGSLENRMRLPAEIVQAIHKACGPDFPVLYRMSLNHRADNGSSVEERLEMVKILDKAGVDIFDIDEGSQEASEWTQPPTYLGDSCMAGSAALAKTVTNKPVLSAGNHNHESAASLVNDGKVDYISIGRGLLADPDYAKKLQEGREEDLRPCLRCNEFCVRNAWAGRPVTCAVNYACGMENEFRLTKTENPQKVVVIGAGPGGLETARVAALKGHTVTVYEISDAPFGQVKAAGQPPFKKQLRAYMQYLLTQVTKLGVEIVYNKEIKSTSPELDSADHIIVAVGSKRIVPPIPGADKKNVIEVVDAHCSRHGEIGNTVVVAGGGVAGCECALELAMEGKDVTVIEMADDYAPDAFLLNKLALNNHLAQYHVKMLTGHKVLSFEDDSVIVENNAGEKKTLTADTAIVALGHASLKDDAEAIFMNHPNVKIIGDCVVPGLVGNAVRDGFAAAWGIN